MSQPFENWPLLRRLARARNIDFDLRPLPQSRVFTASDGLRLHYLDWAGSGPVLVLLHGGMLSAHSFDLLALALGADFRCLSLDLRGHGDSGWADDYRVDRWAADVCELVQHLAVTSVHLVGMSLGGAIAGHAVPGLGGKVASLTFVDVGPEVNFGATARMRAFFDDVRPVAAVETLSQQAMTVSRQADPDLIGYRYQSLLVEGPGGFVWRADRRRPANYDHILACLAELPGLGRGLRCPVLVIKGGRSQVLIPARAAKFASAFANGRWELIRDAGHNVQEDQPVALAGALRSLINLA